MSPKEECEVLMNELISFGKKILKKQGEFYPFGGVMYIDESTSLLGFHGGDESPDSKDVMDGLIEACKQLIINNEIKSSGIVWNASVITANGEETDAILISLEHKDEYSVKVAYTYKKGLFKRFKWGELVALNGDKNIF